MRTLELTIDTLTEERLMLIRHKYRKTDIPLEEYASLLFCKYLALLQPQTPALMDSPVTFLQEEAVGRPPEH